MEGMTKEMGRVELNNGDHRRSMNGNRNDNDQAVEMMELQGIGKVNNNGKKNEKTTLRTPADIYEYPSFYSFILDMPGLDALNIKVKVENGILHVTGKKTKMQMKAGNGDDGEVKAIRIERRRARYMRKFTLPNDATHEHVKATYQDGVLSISVSKKFDLEKSTPDSPTNVNVS
ncbi:17.3 kDa class II heat shock protein-like [Silene latifolia]|uniref:17.3 kDa class II heat shock protein-like n=1 Tax=Silene latifolia TaxID=37657 RepID=UPI003D76F167